MKKTITVDGKELVMRASGLTPVLYLNEFGDDFMNDLASLANKIDSEDGLPPNMLVKAGKIAYILNRQGDPSQPDNFEEWLDQFETFSIMEVFPQILELLSLNNQQKSKSKKANGR